MMIEQTIQGVRITDYIEHIRISRNFIGYSLREAKKLFRQVMRDANESLIINRSYFN